jgi:hypothetical protein
MGNHLAEVLETKRTSNRLMKSSVKLSLFSTPERYALRIIGYVGTKTVGHAGLTSYLKGHVS